MPIKKEDAARALELLKDYRGQLSAARDKSLQAAFENVIRVFEGHLFKALLDIQEYYEITLLNDTKSSQQKQQDQVDNHNTSKWDTELLSSAYSNHLTTSFNNYSAASEEPLPPPPSEAFYPLIQKTVDPKPNKVKESEDGWKYEEINLERGTAGLGFSIAGGTDIPHIGNDPSIYVTKLIDGGAAVADGRLRINDIIVSVNGLSTLNMTHAESVDALKKAGKAVHLVVKRLCRITEENLLEIDLVKGNKGLGFSIAGGIGSQHVPGDNGIFVTKVIDGGAAYHDGRLAVGDCLLAVNEVSLENVTHEAAVAALKATKEHVKLLVKKPMEGETFSDDQHHTLNHHLTTSEDAVGGGKVSRKPRKVILKKGPTGFGFNIVGGEDGEGIFVSFILAGGAADLSGELHKGDQLLSVNGIDIREATHEQAAAALKGAGDVAEVILQYKPDEYRQFEAKINDLREQMLSASTGATPKNTKKQKGFFVRALFDQDPSKESGIPDKGLGFRFGDVLHVMSDINESEWWQAQKVFPEEDESGFIPSQQRVEANQRKYLKNTLDGGKKKKKSKKNRDNGTDEQDDSGQLILSYQPVTRIETEYVRPLIILGALKDWVYDALIQEFPNSFGSCIPHTTRPKKEHEVDGRDYHFVASREQMERDIENHLFVEAGQYSDNLYGTSIQSVKDVAESGKHCILDIGASAILRLQSAGLYPINIFIRPKSVEALMQWNIAEDEAQEMFKKAVNLEKKCSKLFTAVVNEDTPDDIFMEVKRIIEMHSEPVIWISNDSNND